jgi:hypothetical protein
MLFVETVAVYCENHTEHTDTVRSSQQTHYVSATEPNRLMLFGETVAVYSNFSFPGWKFNFFCRSLDDVGLNYIRNQGTQLFIF